MNPTQRSNQKIASAFYQYLLDEYNVMWKENKEGLVSWDEYRNNVLKTSEKFETYLHMVRNNTKEIMELL